MEKGVGLKRKTRENSSDEDLDERLQSLGKRLGKNQHIRQTEGSVKSDNAGFGNALRLSTEFVAAILVGAAIGYAIDRLAGTTPWAMIVFLLLGFVAGVLNVLRTAGEISHPGKLDGD